MNFAEEAAAVAVAFSQTYDPSYVIQLNRHLLLQPDEIQPLQYVVILDFEATCEADRAKQVDQEIIEFPALLLNVRDGRIEDEFRRFVRPVRQPELSKFCQQLTGISQADVDGAEPFPTVMHEFIEWLTTHGLDPDHVSGPRYICLTHGDWDLSEMLPREMTQHNLCGKVGFDAACLRRWINLNPLFDAAFCVTPGCLPRTSSGVESMLAHLGMRYVGRLHCGIDDARNIARIVQRLIRFDVRVTPMPSICHRCGLPGHLARLCPLSTPQHATSSSSALNGSAKQLGSPSSLASSMVPAAGHHHQHPHLQHHAMAGGPSTYAAMRQRPGDWICGGCGTLMFARRTECFQCRAPRAAAAS